MIDEVIHIGLTVSDIEKSIHFYKNVLGLNFKGQMFMEGEATEKLFDIKNCKVKVAYLTSSDKINTPSIELIEFENSFKKDENIRLNKTSISEVCFNVKNIDAVYNGLLKKEVEFLSEPQYFDLTDQGFGKSKAVYFKDPDGIVLELMETIK